MSSLLAVVLSDLYRGRISSKMVAEDSVVFARNVAMRSSKFCPYRFVQMELNVKIARMKILEMGPLMAAICNDGKSFCKLIISSCIICSKMGSYAVGFSGLFLSEMYP